MSGALAATAGEAAEAAEEETDGADAAALGAEGGASAGGPDVVVMAAEARKRLLEEDEAPATSLPRAKAAAASESIFSCSFEEREEGKKRGVASRRDTPLALLKTPLFFEQRKKN